MPPQYRSRYLFCEAYVDPKGRRVLTERVPFRYQALADTRLHTVEEGDSLFSLAGAYFAPLPRACGLWWVVADFQPDPVFDPTLALVPGTVIHIPSQRVLEDAILSEARRGDFR
jgi:hypothetical protein